MMLVDMILCYLRLRRTAHHTIVHVGLNLHEVVLHLLLVRH